MKHFVTGGAGFIGGHLVDRLLSEGNEVVAYDNFSTGLEEFLGSAGTSKKFLLVRGDTLELARLTKAMEGCEFVFHLAANADVRFGVEHPRRDLEQNTVATYNVLEAMRKNGIRKIAFSSTGSIYGEPDIFPTPENAPFPIQTSFYGASKIAGEGLIAAHCEAFGFQAWIYRFVSILGERYSHGHVFDFYKKLLGNPAKLEVLGDGHQKKSYLYIQDCLDAMLLGINKAQEKVNIFNLGTHEYCEVNDSIRWITEYLGLSPIVTYTGGHRGWVGDNPLIFLDCSRIRSLGWSPRITIKEAVVKTLEWLIKERWIFEKRH